MSAYDQEMKKWLKKQGCKSIEEAQGHAEMESFFIGKNHPVMAVEDSGAHNVRFLLPTGNKVVDRDWLRKWVKENGRMKSAGSFWRMIDDWRKGALARKYED